MEENQNTSRILTVTVIILIIKASEQANNVNATYNDMNVRRDSEIIDRHTLMVSSCPSIYTIF